MHIPVYDPSAPEGARVVRLNLNKRDASRVGTLWSHYEGSALEILSAEAFTRRYDHRIVHDKDSGQRYELVGDLDTLNRLLDTMTDEEQQELWEQLYERRWSDAA